MSQSLSAEPSPRVPRRRRPLLVVGASLAAVGLAGVGFALGHSTNSTPTVRFEQAAANAPGSAPFPGGKAWVSPGGARRWSLGAGTVSNLTAGGFTISRPFGRTHQVTTSSSTVYLSLDKASVSDAAPGTQVLVLGTPSAPSSSAPSSSAPSASPAQPTSITAREIVIGTDLLGLPNKTPGPERRLVLPSNVAPPNAPPLPKGTTASGHMKVRGGIAHGTVQSNQNGTLTVKRPDGSTVTVTTSSDTGVLQITKASRSDLANGPTVGVTGTRNTDGSITATRVLVIPSGVSFGGLGVPGLIGLGGRAGFGFRIRAGGAAA